MEKKKERENYRSLRINRRIICYGITIAYARDSPLVAGLNRGNFRGGKGILERPRR